MKTPTALFAGLSGIVNFRTTLYPWLRCRRGRSFGASGKYVNGRGAEKSKKTGKEYWATGM